jgi:hypothetical protein
MRPIKYDEKAQEYHERVKRLAAQRRLVKAPKKVTEGEALTVIVLIGIIVSTFVAAIWGVK